MTYGRFYLLYYIYIYYIYVYIYNVSNCFLYTHIYISENLFCDRSQVFSETVDIYIYIYIYIYIHIYIINA